MEDKTPEGLDKFIADKRSEFEKIIGGPAKPITATEVSQLQQAAERGKQAQPKRDKNLYQCTTCLHIVCTVDRDQGVTPFMIRCQSDTGCKGSMQSGFYIAHPMMRPTIEWYRPDTLEGLDRWDIEHIERGGLLMRPIPEDQQQREPPR